jgi:acyl-coenzyme A synthetase/AMP-(fatty) acid ligase
MTDTRAHLADAIRAFISAPDPAGFDALALRIHRWQAAHDTVVRALTDGPVDTSDSIPAVPVALFKDAAVGTVDPNEPHVAFHTSGTTTGASGVHRMRDTALYDLGCFTHAAGWLPDTRQTFALMPDSRHSSLAHMVRGFGPATGPVHFLVDQAAGDSSLDRARLASIDVPTFVCTTAFALDAWMQADPAPLPDGSAIMVTGGFKGRAHALEPDALLEAAERCAPVVLEYGMTELSSQLWAHAGEPYTPPPWLRVRAVDPVSGTPLPAGSRGQLRFLDLCNLDSTVHVETLDEGVVHTDGRVTLFGRLADAPARGCSLAVEDLLQ